MSDITVRELEKQDHDQWQFLFAGYNAFQQACFRNDHARVLVDVRLNPLA